LACNFLALCRSVFLQPCHLLLVKSHQPPPKIPFSLLVLFFVCPHPPVCTGLSFVSAPAGVGPTALFAVSWQPPPHFIESRPFRGGCSFVSLCVSFHSTTPIPIVFAPIGFYSPCPPLIGVTVHTALCFSFALLEFSFFFLLLNYLKSCGPFFFCAFLVPFLPFTSPYGRLSTFFFCVHPFPSWFLASPILPVFRARSRPAAHPSPWDLVPVGSVDLPSPSFLSTFLVVWSFRRECWVSVLVLCPACLPPPWPFYVLAHSAVAPVAGIWSFSALQLHCPLLVFVRA